MKTILRFLVGLYICSAAVPGATASKIEDLRQIIAGRAVVQGEPLDSPDHKLLVAAREGRLVELQSLVTQNANLYYYDRSDMNVLSWAVLGRHPEVVDYLLRDAKFDVTLAVRFRANDRDESLAYMDQAGAPAMAMAAANGDVGLIERFIKLGVATESNEHASADLQPLHLAVNGHHREAAMILLRSGASPTRGSVNGKVPAHLLIEQRDLELLNLCFEAGKLRNDYIYSTGDNALSLALLGQWEEGARMLIRRGVSPYRVNLEGKSAFDLTSHVGLRDLMVKATMERTSDGSPSAQAAIDLFRGVLRNDVGSALNRCDATALNYRDELGRTPLIFAISLGQEESALQILTRRPDLTVMDQGGTALVWACGKRMRAVAEEIIRAHPDLEAHAPERPAALATAALHGDEELVRRLLEAGAKPNPPRFSANQFYRTAVMCAAMKGHREIVKLLIAARANVSEIDQNGSCVLAYAILSDNADIIQDLLDAGADKTYQTKFGFNLASIALAEKKLNALRKLNDLGLRDPKIAAKIFADPTASTEMRQFINRYYHKDADEAGFWDATHTLSEVQQFLDAGGNVNFNGRRTPLQSALRQGNFTVVRVLLDRGAEPTRIGTGDDHYPLEIAASDQMAIERNDAERNAIIELLLKGGANPNTFRSFSSPMLGAIEKGYLTCARSLIAAGADILAKDGNNAGLPEYIEKNPRLSPQQKMMFGQDIGPLYRKALQAGAPSAPTKSI